MEKTSLSDSLFHLYDFMWKGNKLVLWILVIEMYKKMISNAALERKKRQQNLLSLHNAKIKGRVQSIKTLFWPAGMSVDNVLTWEIVLKISHFTLEVLLLLQTFNSWTICKWLLLSVDIPVAKGVYDCLWLNKDFEVTFFICLSLWRLCNQKLLPKTSQTHSRQVMKSC